MKVIAVNGSPRKNWNTATLLKKALEGAASQGADTELFNLYDLNYKGCISCFNCKLEGGASYGHCALNDDLKPLLQKIENADALILGSPVYFGLPTGEMRSFLERLMFQYMLYDKGYSSIFKGKMPVGLIYTMNVDESRFEEAGYERLFKGAEWVLGRIFGSAESLFAKNTYQFDDYSKYETSGLDEKGKAAWRKEVFPEDCRKAFDMGAKFAKTALES